MNSLREHKHLFPVIGGLPDSNREYVGALKSFTKCLNIYTACCTLLQFDLLPEGIVFTLCHYCSFIVDLLFHKEDRKDYTQDLFPHWASVGLNIGGS